MKSLFGLLTVVVIVVVLLGMQWLAWHGPDWVMWEVNGELMLGPGTIASGLVIILIAAVACLTGISE